MTEIYGLFDAADPEAPDRVYTSEAFARLFRTIMRDGIVHNDGDELAVSPTVPAAMSVDVGTGMALVQGRYYINSADLTLTVEAADPSYPRIDRVVVRADLVGRTVHAVVKKGTAAASPVAPPLPEPGRGEPDDRGADRPDAGCRGRADGPDRYHVRIPALQAAGRERHSDQRHAVPDVRLDVLAVAAG